MAIDTKAILARADEALGLAEKASQQGPRRVDPCALIPQLAADVRALVGEVERLQIGTEWDLREQLASVLNSNAKWQKQDEKNGLKIIAWRQRAEKAEADADALGKTALEQAERAKKAEARVKELEAENSLIRGSWNWGWAAFHEAEAAHAVEAGRWDEKHALQHRVNGDLAKRVKELEDRDAERLRPGHACDFSADLTVMTTRAELAEARVKELEARHISDCEHAKIIQGANEMLAGDLKRAQKISHHNSVKANALMEAHGAALEKAEAHLAVAVAALRETRCDLEMCKKDPCKGYCKGRIASAALAKIAEEKP